MEHESQGPIVSWALQFEITASTETPSLDELMEESITHRVKEQESEEFRHRKLELVEIHAILQATFRHRYTNYEEACELLGQLCSIEKDQRKYRKRTLYDEVVEVREILRTKCRKLFFTKYPPNLIKRVVDRHKEDKPCQTIKLSAS